MFSLMTEELLANRAAGLIIISGDSIAVLH